MFETLFTCTKALRRHWEGPLATERAAYLSELALQGMARGTLLRRARYCLCVAVELQCWPADRRFDQAEVEVFAADWALKRFTMGRAAGPRWPREHFRFAATDFLRSLGRLCCGEVPVPDRYDAELTEFVAAQQEGQWLSEATCRSGRWQIRRFLDYLEQRTISLADVEAVDINAFYESFAQRWSRSSISTSAKMLRNWFRYCESRGWVRPGLAAPILLPRLYCHEGLPLGPTWDAVGRMFAETSGDDVASIRDHAIILLLSVYGVRSGEVRRLRLEDIDWAHDRIRFIRSKSGRPETAPLEPKVGNAIARYLRQGRPATESRVVFLTLLAPHRPLSAGGLYNIVEHHLSKDGSPKKGRGPHGLRHACARHLIEEGLSFKEVGDHLGHRSPDATRVYAKVNLASLRRVAFEDLGGLV